MSQEGKEGKSMKLKRVLSVVMAAAMVMSMTACGGGSSSESGGSAAGSEAKSSAAESAPESEAGGSEAEAAGSEAEAGGSEAPAESSGLSGTLKVAAVETAYGQDMWKEVCAAFEAANEGVTVELTIDKKLEDIISPEMKSGVFPDVIMRAVGAESGLTETFVKDNNLVDLTDVLAMEVPGESVTVGDKILPGFVENSITNPYGDGKTYLMPMFYGPCGLFYKIGRAHV